MKEFSVILAAALFVGIFSSCSSKSKDTPAPPPAPTPPTLKEYLHTKHVIHINSSGKKAGGRIYTYDVHGRLVEEGSEFVINFEENLVKTRYSHSDYNEDGTLRSLKEYTSPDTGVSYALTYQIKYHYEKVNGKPQLVREEKYVPDGSAEATKLVSRKEYTWENGRKAKIVDYSTYNEQTKQLSETSTIKYRYVGAKEIAELYPTGVTTATQIEESLIINAPSIH